LRELAHDIENAVADQQLLAVGSGPTSLRPDTVEQIASRWINSVQLSEPRASLAPVDQVLNEMASLFLKDHEEQAREYRDHRHARSFLRRGVRRALRERFDLAQVEAFTSSRQVRGGHQAHNFDLVIGNGVIYGAGAGLSFENPEPVKSLQVVSDALAWSIDDVRQRDKDLSIAVVVLPPIGPAGPSHNVYAEAGRIYRELGAEVFTPDGVSRWANQIAAKLPK